MENKTNRVAPRDLLERALASPNGVRIFFLTQEEAVSMRNRMNAVNTEHRKKNNKVYAPTDPGYNYQVRTSVHPGGGQDSLREGWLSLAVSGELVVCSP